MSRPKTGKPAAKPKPRGVMGKLAIWLLLVTIVAIFLGALVKVLMAG